MEQSLQNTQAAYKPSVEAVKIEIHKPTVSPVSGADSWQSSPQSYNYPQYQLMPTVGQQGGMMPVAAGAGQPVYSQSVPQYQMPVSSQYAMPSAAFLPPLVGSTGSVPQCQGPVYNQYFISTPPQAVTQRVVQQPAPPPYPMMYPAVIPQYIPIPMFNCGCGCCCNCNRQQQQQQQQSVLPAQDITQGLPAKLEQEPLANQSLQSPQNDIPAQVPPSQSQDPLGAQNMQPPPQPPPPQNMQQPPAGRKQKPQGPAKTHLSDEYIKSLENYLNNPNSDVRQIAIKEILKRLKEDKTLRDDPALTNLINKALRDRSMVNRTLALSILYGDYADGDDLTIDILKDMQKSNKAFNQDAHTANSLLLKRMGEASKIEEPSDQVFDPQPMPGQFMNQGFNPQIPPLQSLQNPQMQGPPPEQNFNPEAMPQQQGPQDWAIKAYRPDQSIQNTQLQSPQPQTGQNLNVMSK